MRVPARAWTKWWLAVPILVLLVAPARPAELIRLGASFSAAGLSPDGTIVVGEN
jgi:hypothetical protein